MAAERAARLETTFGLELAERLSLLQSLLTQAEVSFEVVRHLHSLKGAARAVDLRSIENLAHRLETLFARIRAGVVSLDAPVIIDPLDNITGFFRFKKTQGQFHHLFPEIAQDGKVDMRTYI